MKRFLVGVSFVWSLVSLNALTLDALMRHSWPGNVRELRNTIERLVVSSRGSLLEAFDLPPALRASSAVAGDHPFADLPTLDEVKPQISEALTQQKLAAFQEEMVKKAKVQ